MGTIGTFWRVALLWLVMTAPGMAQQETGVIDDTGRILLPCDAEIGPGYELLILYDEDLKPSDMCQLVYVDGVDIPLPDVAENPVVELPAVPDEGPEALETLVHLSELAVFAEELDLELRPLFSDLVPLRSHGHFRRYLAPAILARNPAIDGLNTGVQNYFDEITRAQIRGMFSLDNYSNFMGINQNYLSLLYEMRVLADAVSDATLSSESGIHAIWLPAAEADRYKHELRLYADKISKAAKDIHTAFYECAAPAIATGAKFLEAAQDDHEGNLWERAGLYAFDDFLFSDGEKQAFKHAASKTIECMRPFFPETAGDMSKDVGSFTRYTELRYCRMPFDKDADCTHRPPGGTF
ncbi:hypothetical protein [Nitratireductor sp. XY-223]|uniref:hypothetical protein n=1 Tax=Nitratireductor sp. XY-223 TaxID=2561926 RepID=UPI0010AB27B8|nr:hypothetical protein [Nitratireductor sp. XY-223]